VVGSDDTLDRDAIKNYKRAAEETGADVIIANVKVNDRIKSASGRVAHGWDFGDDHIAQRRDADQEQPSQPFGEYQ